MNTLEASFPFTDDVAKAMGLFTMENSKRGLQKIAENNNKLINLIMASTDDEDTKRVYSVEDIQKILGISRTTAYALIKQAPFRVVHIGNAIRISKVDFDRWLDNPEYRQEV